MDLSLYPPLPVVPVKIHRHVWWNLFLGNSHFLAWSMFMLDCVVVTLSKKKLGLVLFHIMSSPGENQTQFSFIGNDWQF